ncbi:LOW QUALITY PROTEIN: uncharacterized protein T551_02192 [Pneumocystis jirovecii RU7]|uniref:Uncharacterized protein n=1 Tax=Pneumocystis jirovecii (strain RU7) TaxID=1408657 RepID=A0A0W4ZMH4_PNEJ7|nr:LOW QUALITY PROTEIN: uncharacterized protein T551_02192 [Pneumocystis jirovecii RU7]KTW29576.1 LOW QUALITY PROTEIN: hypothetical protein T551_02192 [Pneumocystis jirovecii RU7]
MKYFFCMIFSEDFLCLSFMSSKTVATFLKNKKCENLKKLGVKTYSYLSVLRKTFVFIYFHYCELEILPRIKRF